MRKSCGPALIVLLCCAQIAQAQGAGRPQLDRFLRDVHSFHSLFEQRLYDETGELLETATGEVSIARPGRFNWAYESPYHQRIVSDGKTLWIYDADLEQVTVNEVKPGATDSAARLLGDEIDIDATFKVAELPSEQETDWLQLTPKSPGQQFNEVALGVRKGVVVGMRLKDNLGQTTAISFSKFEKNPAIEPAMFKFVPPPGVDIIHGTGP